MDAIRPEIIAQAMGGQSVELDNANGNRPAYGSGRGQKDRPCSPAHRFGNCLGNGVSREPLDFYPVNEHNLRCSPRYRRAR